LENIDVFSPVLVRPTNVYGRSSSYYRAFFVAAAQPTAKAGLPLPLIAPGNFICHAPHVDDCADAYVAIAEHKQQDQVIGQVFNISARRYETVDEIAQAQVKEYGIEAGLKYVDPKELKDGENIRPAMLLDFPQWTSSDKLRNSTDWRDRRPLFSESTHVYRLAYEAAEGMGLENIQNLKGIVDYLDSTVEN
jgi:nucleoside-diphosphate-sugar epimerase